MPAVFVGFAGLEVIIIGLFALLVAYTFRTQLQALFYGLSVGVQALPEPLASLGSWLLDKLDDVYNAVMAWSIHWVTTATEPFTAFLDNVASNLRSSAYTGRQFNHTVALAFDHLVRGIIGNAITGTVSYVQDSVGNLVSWTLQLVTTTQTNIVQWATGAYTNLAEWTKGEIDKLQGAVHSLKATLDADIAMVEGEIVDAENAAVGYTQQAFGIATDYTLRAATGVQEHLEDELDDAYNKLATTIVATQDWARQGIETAENLLNGEIGDVVRAVETNVIPRVIQLELDADACFRPTCNNLLDFAKGFGLIGDLIGGAALISLLYGVVHDPDGAASEIAGEARDLVDGPLSTITEALGIHL